MTVYKPTHVVPKLRFPEFAQGPGWDYATVAELVETVTPPKKLTTSTYLPDGRFPVIDQSQSFICGWTNDDESVITKPLPVIVFGDHTCVLKFVSRPFAQGADGIKILTARRRVSTFYLYHQLTYRPVLTQEYKRHFSALRDKVVYFPDQKSGEQQKIADCYGSLDDLIAAEGRKLEALRQHKLGLMQQLFPQPGETVPRLRFPEFLNGSTWDELTIGDVCDLKAGDFIPASEIAEHADEGSFPCYGGNGLRGYVKSFTHEGRYVLVGRQGALCGNVNLYAGKFHATEHALVATPKPGIDTGLLFYALDVLKLNRFSTGQAQPGLSVGVLRDIGISVPIGEDEQQKIADCLGSLNDLIAAEGQKLETLREHKQGLMQQLFPSPEAV